MHHSKPPDRRLSNPLVRPCELSQIGDAVTRRAGSVLGPVGRLRGPIILIPLFTTGCGEAPFSALDPAGPAAGIIADLWWVMFWGSMIILAGMVGLTLYAVLRSPVRYPAIPSRALILGGGLAFPLAVITVLLVYGIYGGQALLGLEAGQRAFKVEVTGHQWWWEVRYPEAEGGPLHDANEVHIPAGRPVDVYVTTGDVIHSFWVPRLGGKVDAIPGRTNVIRLEATEPGVYHGLCAEFCGAQHARMGLVVEAHDDEALEGRLERLAERSRPFDEALVFGAGEAFHRHCATCHSVDARQTEPMVGPNLAGLPDRRHLGAGTIRHDEGAVRYWVRRHQQIKPGNHMPDFSHLDDETVEAIAHYLEQSE